MRTWKRWFVVVAGFAVMGLMPPQHAWAQTAPAAAAVQSAPAGLPADVQARIERAITTEMARQDIPAVSIAVAVDGIVRWSNGYGMADLENFVPATASTMYRVASVTKPITATAVMQLVEAGKLDLDAPIQRYVPTFPEKPWPITLRHLLSHVSGIRAYKGSEQSSTKYYATLTEGLELFKDDPLLHQPGTKYSYSTYNYNLLGIAVEAASGVPFYSYIRDHILKPAGADHVVVDEVAAIIPNRAEGYVKSTNGELRNSLLADTSYKIPAGGLCAPVVDLAKFAIAFQSAKLVKPETVRQMWTVHPATDRTPLPGNRLGYGIGWMMRMDGSDVEIYHTGNQQRVSNLLYLEPRRRVIVVLFTNLENSRILQLARDVSTIVLGSATSAK
ncbi:MAG: beta-lactamase family protein [Acidobacteria bacterium]|nr:beta-lactamase family protein [Acidobacteriota bacterium]